MKATITCYRPGGKGVDTGKQTASNKTGKLTSSDHKGEASRKDDLRRRNRESSIRQTAVKMPQLGAGAKHRWGESKN